MPQKTNTVIGLTGPSHFTQECMDSIEELLGFNFVQLYHGNDENMKYWLNKVDGVIVAGGVDIHPTVYSQSIWNNHNLSKFDIKRDMRELAIIEFCIQNKKPLLGICRGHQLLGVRHGMGFIMDLSNSSVCHQPQRSNISTGKNEPIHHIEFIDESAHDLFYNLYKMPEVAPERQVLNDILHEKNKNKMKLWVNSFHHQGVAFNPKRQSSNDYANNGIIVLAKAAIDLNHCKEIVELMQGKDNRWLSCQWHPEYDFRENTVSRVVLERFKALVEGAE